MLFRSKLVACAGFFLILGLLLASGESQQGNVVMVSYPGPPSGSCASFHLGLDVSSGDLYACKGQAWVKVSGGAGGSFPSGMLVAIASGSCPSGWSEVDTYAGQYVLSTTTASGDVGTTGGSTSYTPTGTVSAPSFTGSAGTVPAEAFTGALDTTSADSAGTPAGTNSTGTVTPAGTIAWPAAVPTNATGTVTPTGSVAWPAGVPTQASDTFTTKKFTTSGSGTDAFTGFSSAGAISWPAGVPTFSGASSTTSAEVISWPTGVPAFAGSSSSTSAELFTGSALGTHSHTVTPTGTNSTVSFTPAGVNSAPSFTGSAATIQQPYVKVILCKSP